MVGMAKVWPARRVHVLNTRSGKPHLPIGCRLVKAQRVIVQEHVFPEIVGRPEGMTSFEQSGTAHWYNRFVEELVDLEPCIFPTSEANRGVDAITLEIDEIEDLHERLTQLEIQFRPGRHDRGGRATVRLEGALPRPRNQRGPPGCRPRR